MPESKEKNKVHDSLFSVHLKKVIRIYQALLFIRYIDFYCFRGFFRRSQYSVHVHVNSYLFMFFIICYIEVLISIQEALNDFGYFHLP